MSMHDRSHHDEKPQGSVLTARAGLVLIGVLVVGGLLLLTEHRAHVLGALPLLLLLLGCVFMHMFMHGGPGGHGGHGGHGQRNERNPS